ncbi:AMP-binding protein [Streptomyces sp. LX-29]|uniref:AMP-binding protein n=1 Tax=Streptomyces sp. LX-29 TaxID=2900152 RepID=UPI00240D8217|nr:AMP-binding protein [Streptomyces sp. LX-29]WFB10762.1 AMP-binding protein [Streptomyces sp. LX-29]
MRDLTSWLDNPATDAGITTYDGKQWTRHTYADFADQVFGAAAALRRQGVGRGDRVALVLPSGPEFTRYFFAAMAVGATPTPIAPRGYQGPVDYGTFVAGLLDTLRPGCVVAEGPVLDLLAGLPEAAPRVIDARRPLPPADDRTRVVLDKDDLALIQFTSGSSSAPRGVTLTSEAALAQVALLEDKYRIEPESSFGSWLPLHHDMGLIGLFLTPVVLGCEVSLMRPEHFVRRPLEWLKIFGERGGTISAIPNFALERVVRRVRPEDLEGMDFGRWRALIIGSDRVSMSVLDAFHGLLAPHGLTREALSPSYGMAEATLAVSGVGHGREPEALLLGSTEFSQGAPVRIAGRRRLAGAEPGDRTLHSVVSCGTELVGVDITVTGEDGHALPDGHVGELLVRSPALSRGYFGAPPEDDRFTTGGYRTGDLGFRHEEQIYVLGRVGDSVKVNGRYVTAEDVELALVRVLELQHDKLAVVLHSVSGTPAALVTVQRGAETLDVTRLGDVLESFGLSADRTAVLHVGALAVPRTTSGKPQRGKLWRSLVGGELTGTPVHLGEDFPYAFTTDPDSGRSRVVPQHRDEGEGTDGAARPDGAAQPDGAARLDGAVPRSAEESRALLGGKGHHLTLMRRLGLPVPPFAVLDSAELAARPVDAERIRELLGPLAEAAADTMAPRESAVGLAVRSSPPRSMPGMMDTLLGIGLSPSDVEPLARRLGDRAAAWEVLLTQARHLCRHVGGADPARLAAAEGDPTGGLTGDPTGGPAERYDRLRRLYAELTGADYPVDPVDQVRVAVEAVRASWNSERARQYRQAHGIPERPGPAVVVQALAYGMAGGASGSGVVFSHNPINGDEGLFGEYLTGSTGEDLVSGTRTPQAVAALEAQDPRAHRLLTELVARLHHELGAMADVEFVVERGRLWLVQVRPAAAAPHVLNRVAQRMWRDGRLTARQALARLDADALFASPPARVAGEPPGLLAVGLPACAGVAHGPLVTGVEEVFRHPPGTAVLLRPTTEPADFPAMTQAAAVLTLEGGGTSHAAVVARELDLPTVVGAQLLDPDLAARLRAAETEGEPLPEVTVCGTTGRVWLGRVPPAPGDPDLGRAAELPGAVETGTVVCRTAGPEAAAEAGRAVVLVDRATGRPLAVAADPDPTAAASAPERALVCAAEDELPADGGDRLVATGDPAVAETWAARGGRVAYLHPAPDPARPWRTRLPDCRLAFVALPAADQREHARWSLAIAAARRDAR